MLTARAAVSEAEGNLKDAERLYREVAARWEEFGYALETGSRCSGRGGAFAT